MSAIFRYEVPVDDDWHAIELTGEILHVGSRRVDVVEFWSPNSDGLMLSRHFRVFGTGHPLPDGCVYRGTAIAPGGALVWHLIERPSNG